MKIKKLEWRRYSDGYGGYIGDKMLSFVKIGWGGPEYRVKIYPTIEAAQEAAQSDFEALVREYVGYIISN